MGKDMSQTLECSAVMGLYRVVYNGSCKQVTTSHYQPGLMFMVKTMSQTLEHNVVRGLYQVAYSDRCKKSHYYSLST